MVRTAEGTYPLTDFIGREQSYDDKLFVPAPVKKGKCLTEEDPSRELLSRS